MESIRHTIGRRATARGTILTEGSRVIIDYVGRSYRPGAGGKPINLVTAREAERALNINNVDILVFVSYIGP